MTIPAAVKESLKQQLWDAADQLEWDKLTNADKARFYDIWTKDDGIGGVISRYIDGSKVRVYIKDTLLKEYGKSRISDPDRPFRSVGLTKDVIVAEKFIKPHGVRLVDGRVLCWGRADDWKTVLLAVHERSFVNNSKPFAAALFSLNGRYHDIHTREVVVDAALKLRIERLEWLV